MAAKKKFNFRGFISLYIFLTIIIITFSGIVLYFSPPGRVAHWSNWTFIGLTKEGWQAVHTIFTFIFVIAAILHIYYNWNALIHYLKQKIKEKVKLRTELVAASAVTILFFVITAADYPPFSSIMDWGEDLSESWSSDKTEPPVPHAELLTISEFAALVKISAPELVKVLRNNDIDVSDTTLTVQEVADLNEVSPNYIYNILQDSGDIDESQIQQTEYTGLGRKSLKEALNDEGAGLNKALENLNKRGIEAEPDQKMKSIADDHGLTPLDILEIARGDK